MSSLRKSLLIGLLLTLPACTTPAPAPAPPIQAQPSTPPTSPTVATEPLFCVEYHLVEWSTHDTDLTKQQVQANNQLWRDKCAAK